MYRTQVHKFSCKPPGHDAARQRENQRRHRARVKGRVAELEEALSKAQNNLDDALGRIESLTAEVQQLRHALGSSSTFQRRPTASQEQGAGVGNSIVDCADDRRKDQHAVRPEFPHPIIPETRTPAPDNDCPLLPAPGVGESTMPCRVAYSILKDRSAPEVDLSAANEWLKPGFRRAIVPGAGCRVQTHILFAFTPTTPTPTTYPTMAAAAHNPLGHISIGVRDYEVSKAFYTAVLAPLGLKLVYDSEAPVPGTKEVRTLGYGADPKHELLNIFEFGDDAAPPRPGFHLALNAPTRDAVVEFHATAMASGGANNGLPGVRKHYGANYFAAFVMGGGWSLLEVVCK
ncbi:hypothetical protein C8A00DRAFT_46026 [Chaetomidium leptoderma]|uniref:VOC domain-containing protein n=1 Tax=Chaetomidium leptoderma TaxID=669021 RepID=A0AAN6ZUE2_9PEZI|nr:hypothetical protein C8A00DRAFT_46026 [Chaetomidium leptoderma]